ncbi:unnamed protein product [Effrenium voratum]|nr:unnamed protein product [Effrenium voratum]
MFRVYPDEWHWREGISKPDKFREIVNAWKSSPLVASVALSAQVAQKAAALMGWEAVRLAQEDVLWKPPGASGVGYHQDSAYISQNFRPLESNSVTVWIALDDADADTGVVEYAVGSHRWPAFESSAVNSSFHGAKDEQRKRLAQSDWRAALPERPQSVLRVCDSCGLTVGLSAFSRGLQRFAGMVVFAGSAGACPNAEWLSGGLDEACKRFGAARAAVAAGWLAAVRAAAEAAKAELEIRRLAVPMGGAVFHHQDTWHGSGPNRTSDRPRRALGVHLLRRRRSKRAKRAGGGRHIAAYPWFCAPKSCDVTFRAEPPPEPSGGSFQCVARAILLVEDDYIYGRYVLAENSEEVSEQFFPITWTPSGRRSLVRFGRGSSGPLPWLFRQQSPQGKMSNSL